MADGPNQDTYKTASGPNDAKGGLPSITLPKGGGAIRGIGEKFGANPVTGSLMVPIFTSPNRSDFYPKLSLSYDSGGSNGPFALGWNLKVPSIRRKTEKGLPQYADEFDSDLFILSDTEDLIPALVPNVMDARNSLLSCVSVVRRLPNTSRCHL